MNVNLNHFPPIIRVVGCLALSVHFAALPARGQLALHEGEVSDAFLPVAERLDLGGPVFLYVDLEEDMLSLARQIEPLIGIVQEAVSPIPPIPISAEAIVREANLSGLRAFGLSSVRHQGLYRNSVFLYLPEGRNGLFQAFGGDPGPFVGLRYTPADASYFYEIEYDIPALLETIKNVSRVVMGEAGPNMIEAALQERMESGNETTYRMLVEQLRGRLSAAVNLDRTARVPIPDTNVSIPGIEFFARVENLGPILTGFIRNDPRFEAFDREGSPAYRMREPIDPELMNSRLVFLTEGNDVFIASSEGHLDRVLGLQNNHLGNDVSFLNAVQALGGARGNQIEFARPEVYEELRHFMTSLGGDEEMGPVFDFLSSWMPRTNRPTVSLRHNLPDGILVRSELPASHKSSLARAGAFPLAMMASIAIPTFSRVAEVTAADSEEPDFPPEDASPMESMADSDARWLASGAQRYFSEFGRTSVVVEYNPASGELSGSLSHFVRSLNPDYYPFPETLSVAGNFVLGHPDLPFDREYSSEGHYLGPADSD